MLLQHASFNPVYTTYQELSVRIGANPSQSYHFYSWTRSVSPGVIENISRKKRPCVIVRVSRVR